MFSWCEWGISQFVRDLFPLKFNLITKSYRPAVMNISYKPLRTASFGLVRLIYCILRFSVIVCFSKCSVVEIGHAMTWVTQWYIMYALQCVMSYALAVCSDESRAMSRASQWIDHVMTRARHFLQSQSNTGDGMALVITTRDELTLR